MRSLDHTQFGHVPGLLPDANQRHLVALLVCQGDLAAVSHFPSPADRDAWLATVIESGKTDPRVRDLLPLAYHCLSERGIDVKDIAYLRSLRLAFAGRNHQQADAWSKVVFQLQLAGIDPVMLKGNSLIVDYYDDPTLRPMTDADILVRIEDQSRAGDILQTLGFRKVTLDQDTTNPEFEHATPYTRAGREWSDIDLHVHVLSKCHAAEIDQWFFNQLEEYEFYGVKTHRLNPTALLTHLLLHGLRHSSTTPIRWIVDCHHVLHHRADDINWREMLSFARQHQFTLRLSLALLYLHDEFGSMLPTDVEEHLRWHRPRYFERMETTFLLKLFPEDASLLSRSLYLVRSMSWRACRMRGGWYIPLDFIRVVRHLIAGRSVRTALVRAWRYGKNN